MASDSRWCDDHPLCDRYGCCADAMPGLTKYRKHIGRSVGPVQLSPDASQARKAAPVFSGPMSYFPDALMELARLCQAGNDKHNKGEPLHWARGKSTDHLDCIARHLLEAGTIDPETGFYHDAAVAWRALANLQELLERTRGLPMSRGSKP